LQRGRAINEENGIVDIVFVTKLSEKPLCETGVCGRLKLCMQQIVCIGIDGGVQPILLVVELDHGFVDRNVIRTSS
jgi:hypothetical protein